MSLLTRLASSPVQHQVVCVVCDEADLGGAVKALRLLQHNQQLRLAVEEGGEEEWRGGSRVVKRGVGKKRVWVCDNEVGVDKRRARQ